MKRTLGIIAVVVALIAGAVGIGWLYFRSNPEAWDNFVAEMQGESTGSTVSRPVKRSPRKSGKLFASGAIEAEKVSIAAEMGGRVVEMLADEGEEVLAGQVLVKLDQTMLVVQRGQAQAAVDQAQAGLEAAQAQLAQAKAGARPEEIAQAEAAVGAAQAALEMALGQKATAEGQLEAAEAAQAIAEAQVATAQANLDSAKAQLALAQAGPTEADLALAQSGVDGALAQLNQLLAGPREQEIEIAKQNWDLALNTVWQAQLERDALKGTPGIPGYQKDLSDAAVSAAQIAARIAQLQHELTVLGATDEQTNAARAVLRQAQARRDKVKAGARPAEIAMAQAGVDAAEAQLTQAEAGVEAAMANVETAQAAVETTRAAVGAAQAQLDQVQAALDMAKAGARVEEIALLEANVDQAEAAVAAAQAGLEALDVQLGRMTLAAPVSGIVVESLIHVGELASPGAPLLTLVDLDEVTLTVYVPEADLGQVSLGQRVEVTVDAYEEVFGGHVSHIASQAEFTPKNVQTQEERVHMVFAVKIKLDNPDHLLKPGMPADAAFR